MNIIIPMAGRGTRMRPHTLTTPKPLLPIAGKAIVERLVESLANLINEKIENIGFIIGDDFGEEVEAQLLKLANKFGAHGKIYYQTSPEGIAHALLCGEEIIEGKMMVALSDTLFVTDAQINSEEDGVLFVHKVNEPSSFGVVELDDAGVITGLVEKPQEFVSDLAIIGIYYFKEGEKLRDKMKFLLENNIRTKGEFQLTDAIELLRKDGAELKTQKVDEWLDCGNKDATVNTNQRILALKKDKSIENKNFSNENSIIIEPCYLGENVKVENSIIGPYVSIENDSIIKSSIISNTIVQSNTKLENRILKNSMLGNHVNIKGRADSISVGDYSFNE